jgi:3-oxoacyl-[acyl-carrier protein] reductase
VADEIKRNGGEAIAVAGDVTNVNFPKEVIQKTIDAFGKINILVNNAG